MSSQLTLNKWRVWCVTENAFVYIWLDEDQDAPTTCPTNTGHTITTALTKIIEIRDPEVFSIKQETTPTGENYFFSSQSFIALANQTTSYSFSYPFPVSVLSAQYVSAEENRGDTWTWTVSPNTTVGALTSDVSATDTVINVSSTVTDNIKIGFGVNIFDGVNTDDLGRVLAVDSDAGTITVETAATQSFAAATPTYVRMNIYFCKDMSFGHPWALTFGDNKIQSSYVPANTVVQVDYVNNDPTKDKEIVTSLELMF